MLSSIISFVNENILLNIIFAILVAIYILFEVFGYVKSNQYKINANKLVNLINKQDPIIIDLRSVAKFLLGHIISSRNIELIEFTQNLEQHLIKIDPNKIIVLVDDDGSKSKNQVVQLLKLGFKQVYYLDYGIIGWQEHQQPLVISNQNNAITTVSKDPINQPNIIIYTKGSCPYCIGAKNLLNSKNYLYKTINVYDYASKEYQDMLLASGGVKTFPQILINNKSIGGFTELKNLNDSGELDRMIKSDL